MIRAVAQVHRRLAIAYELSGAWDQALAARQIAADAFAAGGQLEQAATERLSAAAHLRSAGSFRTAYELLSVARGEAEQSQRWDLQARIMGLDGSVRVHAGEVQTGFAMVRAGLALAMTHNLAGPTAEVYQRLAYAFEHTGDYAGAKETYHTAADFCQVNGASAVGQVCLACLTAVLFHTGEWERAETHLCMGMTLLATDKREPAIEHLVQAYRAADKLGAKSIVDQAASELAALGEKMDQRLGRRAARKLQQGGLTRRQHEILKLVAQGQTNGEIAQALFLSPRTVEMHVADILTRLDSHTRTEAVRKAIEFNLLKTP